jgi:hypothetical protein
MSCPPLLFSVSFPFGLSLEYMLGCFLELFTELNRSQGTKTIVKYIQQAIWLCGDFPVQWFDRCSSIKVGRRCAHWKERLVLTIAENPHNFFSTFWQPTNYVPVSSVSHGGGCEGEFMKFEEYICSLSGGEGVRARY